MVQLSIAVGGVSGLLILLGVVLTTLSNAGVVNLLALAYTRRVHSGHFVKVRELPLPFFFSGVLATRGNRALVLAALMAIVRVFLLFAVSFAGFQIHSVEYAIQGIETFDKERALVKFPKPTVATASFTVDKDLFKIGDDKLPSCIRWEDNLITIEKRLLRRDKKSVRIACSRDPDYDLNGTVATFELMKENATVDISGNVLRTYKSENIAGQRVVPWTSRDHSGVDFYSLQNGRGSNTTKEKIVCDTNGKAVSYERDAREFLVFRDNVTVVAPGALRSTAFGRLVLFEELNDEESLNLALRISLNAGTAGSPINVFELIGSIIDDFSKTDQQLNKLVKARGRSDMTLGALVVLISACFIAVLLYCSGLVAAKCVNVLPLNTVDGLSKIYDEDVNKRGFCGHLTQHVTLGITEQVGALQKHSSGRVLP
jgi:hypothetical protein